MCVCVCVCVCVCPLVWCHCGACLLGPGSTPNKIKKNVHTQRGVKSQPLAAFFTKAAGNVPIVAGAWTPLRPLRGVQQHLRVRARSASSRLGAPRQCQAPVHFFFCFARFIVVVCDTFVAAAAAFDSLANHPRRSAP